LTTSDHYFLIHLSSRRGPPASCRNEDLQYRRLFTALCLVTRNRHEAEDVAQEAFVRVFERCSPVTPPAAHASACTPIARS
jgi:hypothetical protein